MNMNNKLQWLSLKRYNHAKRRAPHLTVTTRAAARAKKHSARKMRITWHNEQLNREAYHFDPNMRTIV